LFAFNNSLFFWQRGRWFEVFHLELLEEFWFFAVIELTD